MHDSERNYSSRETEGGWEVVDETGFRVGEVFDAPEAAALRASQLNQDDSVSVKLDTGDMLTIGLALSVWVEAGCGCGGCREAAVKLSEKLHQAVLDFYGQPEEAIRAHGDKIAAERKETMEKQIREQLGLPDDAQVMFVDGPEELELLKFDGPLN